MKKQLLLGFFFLLNLFACDMETSYTARIINSTGEEVQIAYKTVNDYRGPIEETITLKDGEMKVIISTKNLETVEGNIGTTPKPCEFVAEYIKFTIRGNMESTLKWCDPSIQLETADIGQEEFVVNLELGDFPVE